MEKRSWKTVELFNKALIHVCEKQIKAMKLEIVFLWLIIFSLFGAYRYKNPLPWDQDVDLLLRREEMDQVDEEAFVNEFKKRRIRIIYRPWAGSYKIFKRDSQVDMFLFKNFSGTIRRTGIESYLFFVNHRNFHSFPSKYIEGQLPTIEFCGVTMSAPQDGISVQQYLYRDDWLTEKRPKGCQ